MVCSPPLARQPSWRTRTPSRAVRHRGPPTTSLKRQFGASPSCRRSGRSRRRGHKGATPVQACRDAPTTHPWCVQRNYVSHPRCTHQTPAAHSTSLQLASRTPTTYTQHDVTPTSLCTQDAYTTHPRPIHGIRFTPRQSARRINRRRAGPDYRRATTVSEDARRRHLQDGRDLGRGHRVRLGAVPTRSMKNGSGRSSALQPAPSAGNTQDAYNTHSRRTHDAFRFHTERRDDGRTAHPRHTHRTYITHTSRTQRSRRWTHSC